MNRAQDDFDRADLSAYLDGELTPDEVARVEAALDRDPGLRDELERLRAISAAFTDLPELEAPPSIIEGIRREIAPRPAGSSEFGSSEVGSSGFGFPRFGSWAALFLVVALGVIWVGLEATRSGVESGPAVAKREKSDSSGLLEKDGAAGTLESEESAGTADLSSKMVRQTSPSTPTTADPPGDAFDAGGVKERSAPEGAAVLSEGGARSAPPPAETAPPPEDKVRPPAETDRTATEQVRTEQRSDSQDGPRPGRIGAQGERTATDLGVESRTRRSRVAPGLPDPSPDRMTWSFDDEARAQDAAVPPADLTIRIQVPESIGPEDLEALERALGRALATASIAQRETSPRAREEAPEAKKAGKSNASTRDGRTLRRGAARPGTGVAEEGDSDEVLDLAKDPLRTDPLPPDPALPATVDLEVPEEALLAAVLELRGWRQGVIASRDEALAPEEDAPDRAGAAPAPARPHTEAEETEERSPESVRLALEGLSFDTDPERLGMILGFLALGRSLDVDPTGGAGAGGAGEPVPSPPISEHPKGAEEDADESGTATGAEPAPLRVRIILTTEPSGESPR